MASKILWGETAEIEMRLDSPARPAEAENMIAPRPPAKKQGPATKGRVRWRWSCRQDKKKVLFGLRALSTT